MVIGGFVEFCVSLRQKVSVLRHSIAGFGTQFAFVLICKDEWTADRMVEAHKSRGS